MAATASLNDFEGSIVASITSVGQPLISQSLLVPHSQSPTRSRPLPARRGDGSRTALRVVVSRTDEDRGPDELSLPPPPPEPAQP